MHFIIKKTAQFPVAARSGSLGFQDEGSTWPRMPHSRKDGDNATVASGRFRNLQAFPAQSKGIGGDIW
ncbi:hypothetical protein ACU4GD_17775 [Cupriavidus basilensis]